MRPHHVAAASAAVPSSSAAGIQRQRASMRWLLIVAALLAFIAGIQLYVLSEHTDRYFAWTISSPLTAAFIGASFWTGALAVSLALREGT